MARSLSTPAALALLALAGCGPARSGLQQRADQVTATIFNANAAPRPGAMVQPKFCKLDSAIVARPVGDALVESSVWGVADEQAIPLDLRQAFEANGLRIGLVTGELPADVTEAFRSKPPQVEAQWVHIALPDGEHTPIVLGEPVESVSLLLNQGGKVAGRNYDDALARLIVTPRQAGAHDVELRIVPQIQHGDKRRTIGALEGAGDFAPKDFAIKDGQQEDLLRELAATVVLRPGQTLAVGCRSAQARSLGTFLFLAPEPKTDRMLQSILLIQATRNNDGNAPPKLVEDLAAEPATAGPAATVLSKVAHPFADKDKDKDKGR